MRDFSIQKFFQKIKLARQRQKEKWEKLSPVEKKQKRYKAFFLFLESVLSGFK